MKRLGFSLLLNLLTLTLLSQSQVEFLAKANAEKIVKNETLEVQFILKNSKGTDFEPPSFLGFDILSGPSTMVSKTFINGRLTQSLTYSYQIRGLKAGHFTIGKAKINAGGKVLYTTPLKVEVINTSPYSKEQPPLIIRPKFDSLAYIGQQVEVTYYLYSTKQLLDIDVRSNPKFGGTYTLPINFFALDEQIEIINGQQYTVKPIRKFAVFPQRNGVIDIDGLLAQVKVLDKSGNFPQVAGVEIIGESAVLTVNDLDSVPEHFTGGVGRFTFEATMLKQELSTDETTTLVLEITGTGDINAIQVPDLKELKDYFEVYEPAINSKSDESNGLIISRKVMTFQLVPKKKGVMKYVPMFTYFDTYAQQFNTIAGDTLDITINQGSNRLQENNEQDASNDALQDIKPILTSTTFGTKSNLFGTPLFWGLLIAPLFGFIIAVWIKNRQVAHGKRHSTVSKINQADKLALQHLAKAKTHLNTEDKKVFYNEVSKALWGYVSNKLVINQAELSKDNIRSKLSEKGVAKPQIDQFITLLNDCEMAVFAGIENNNATMQNIYEQAIATITALENKEKNDKA